MGRRTNEQQLEHIKNLLNNFLIDRDNCIKKIEKEAFDEITKNLKSICDSSIDSFYEYPTKYKRKESLYNAYEIIIHKSRKTFEVRFDFIKIEDKHPGKGKYIFEWMFGGDPDSVGFPNEKLGGWHGGDISGLGHPNPGTPYLRFGIKQDGQYKFVNGEYWLRKASRTESPAKLIIKNINEEIALRQEIAQEEYDNFFEKNWKEIDRQIKIYVGGN